MWQDLIAVLHELIAAYQEHLTIGEEKRRILISSDLSSLEQILKDQEKNISRIERAEKKRRKIFIDISFQHQNLDTDIKAKDLYQIAPLKLQKALIRLHQDLENIVEQNQNMTQNNEILASAALHAVKIQLNKLTDTTIEPTYGKKGEEKITTKQKEWDA